MSTCKKKTQQKQDIVIHTPSLLQKSLDIFRNKNNSRRGTNSRTKLQNLKKKASQFDVETFGSKEISMFINASVKHYFVVT